MLGLALLVEGCCELGLRGQRMLVSVVAPSTLRSGETRALRVFAHDDETGAPIAGARVSADCGLWSIAEGAGLTDDGGSALLEVTVPREGCAEVRVTARRLLDSSTVSLATVSPARAEAGRFDLVLDRDLPSYRPGSAVRAQLFAIGPGGESRSGVSATVSLTGTQNEVLRQVELRTASGGAAFSAALPGEPGRYTLGAVYDTSSQSSGLNQSFDVGEAPDLSAGVAGESEGGGEGGGEGGRKASLSVVALAEGLALVPGIDNRLFVSVEDAAGKPVSGAEVRAGELRATTSRFGIAVVELDPARGAVPSPISASAGEASGVTEQGPPAVNRDPLAFVLQTDRAVYPPGAPVRVRARAPKDGPIYLELAGDPPLALGAIRPGQAYSELSLPQGLARGSYTLIGYRTHRKTYRWEAPARGWDDARKLILSSAAVVFQVGPFAEARLALAADRPSYAPGQEVVLSAKLEPPAVAGGAAVMFAALDSAWIARGERPLRGLWERAERSPYEARVAPLAVRELAPTSDASEQEAQAFMAASARVDAELPVSTGDAPDVRKGDLAGRRLQYRSWLAAAAALAGLLLALLGARQRRVSLVGAALLAGAGVLLWLSRRPLPSFAPGRDHPRWPVPAAPDVAHRRSAPPPEAPLGPPLLEAPLFATVETNARGAAIVRFKAPNEPRSWSIAAVAALKNGGLATASIVVPVKPAGR